MKKLIFINGTMGVGKTTICKKLHQDIKHSCWLDGDWCWMMNPFCVTEENKVMVMNNIAYILSSYLKNSTFEYVIFNWVMHQDAIISEILNRLDKNVEYQLYKITLVCSGSELEHRIRRDINAGIRDEDSLSRSLEKLSLYDSMDTIKVDVGCNDIEASVSIIKNMVGYHD